MKFLKIIIIKFIFFIFRYKEIEKFNFDYKKNLVISSKYSPSVFYYIKNYDIFNNFEYFYYNDNLSKISYKKNTNIIIVRGLNIKTTLSIFFNYKKITKITIFLDDYIDINSLLSCNDYKINILYFFSLAILASLCIKTSIVVSNNRIKTMINKKNIFVLNPRSYINKKCKNFIYFYHGSESHFSEIEWIRDIVYYVQKNINYAIFEIIGTNRVNKIYRDIPNVRIIHPMSWNNYYKHTSFSNYDIGLAPLLNDELNMYRTYTKFFDITRSNAVGIYSESSVYSILSKYGCGVLLSNDKNLWIKKICYFAENKSALRPILKNSKNFIRSKIVIPS